MTGADLKKLKRSVKAVLKNNNYQCSISIQNIDTNVTAFANMRGAKVSWRKSEMVVFFFSEITFQIPYVYVREFYEYNGDQIEIVLEGRNLVSIREALF